METRKINILGTEYTISEHKISDDNFLKANQWSGYCNEETKEIVIADMSEDEFFPSWTEREQKLYRKKTLRHEIIHAFFNESGLSDNALAFERSWSKNEEMVDWIAIQSPKIFKVFQELDLL